MGLSDAPLVCLQRTSLIPLNILPGSSMWAYKPVYYPALLTFIVLILMGHEKNANSVVAFKMYLDAQAIAGLLELITESFCIG